MDDIWPHGISVDVLEILIYPAPLRTAVGEGDVFVLLYCQGETILLGREGFEERRRGANPIIDELHHAIVAGEVHRTRQVLALVDWRALQAAIADIAPPESSPHNRAHHYAIGISVENPAVVRREIV